jgi:hypothetical protein
MAGTAVLRMVVSSDSMKKATATSHGKSRLEASEGGAIETPAGIKAEHHSSSWVERESYAWRNPEAKVKEAIVPVCWNSSVFRCS